MTIAITGYAVADSLGLDVKQNFQKLINDEVDQYFDWDIVKDYVVEKGMFRRSSLRHFDRAALASMYTTDKALEMAGLSAEHDSTAPIISCSIRGMVENLNAMTELREWKHHYDEIGDQENSDKMQRSLIKVNPFKWLNTQPDFISSYISQHWGFHGPIYSMQATCATSTNAMQHAKMYIENGNAFAILNGYEELSLAPGGNDFFTSLGAKSSTNSCRPFDENRDGTVFKDGYVTMIVEDLDHALHRGADIYGIVDDIAVYNDAANPISPDPKGTGARLAYSQLFDGKDMQIDYISAHATGTQIGDPVEIDILSDYFPDVPVASLKGHIGHGMGASGLLETVYCLEMLKNNTLIHTYGLKDPIASDLNILTKPLKTEVNAILKNNFGFGGRASAFVLQKYQSNF